MKYRATTEIPTRVLKQLAKLGQMLCWVYGLSEFNEKVMKLLVRVGLNTCTGYHVDIVRHVIRLGNTGHTLKRLSAETDILHAATLSNRLGDMEQLRIAYRVKGKDPDSKENKDVALWLINQNIVDLWKLTLGSGEK